MMLAKIRKVIGGKGHDEVEESMKSFLREENVLTDNEVEYLMAAFVYGCEGEKQVKKALKEYLESKHAGVKRVETKASKNKLMRTNYLPAHCVEFATLYRSQVAKADDVIMEEFYKLFSLRFDCPKQSLRYGAHKKDVSLANLGTTPNLDERKRKSKRNKRSMFKHLDSVKSNYVLITGAGVSAQLVNYDGSPEAKAACSWIALLELLRQKIDNHVAPTIKGYFEKWYPVANDTNLSVMVRARMLYGMIRVNNLYTNNKDDYTRFITEVFRSITPTEPTPRIAAALASLNVPIATTNYDTLQEICLKRNEHNISERTVDNEAVKTQMDDLIVSKYTTRIYHLHGVWKHNAELTLGIEYANSDSRFRYAMKVLTYEFANRNANKNVKFLSGSFGKDGQRLQCITKPVVFVGTGAGAFDRHFLPWFTEHGNEQTHYILVQAKEFENMEATIEGVNLTGRLVPVIYGKKYDDLPDFVASLPKRSFTSC